MAQNRLFIRLHPDGPVDWLMERDDGSPATGRLPGLSALAEPESGAPGDAASVVLIVPGEDVLLREVELPARSLAQARAALPWLLEDDMAAAPESQHVALSQPDDAGKRLAIAASRERMDAWTAALAAAGLTADCIAPDFALLDAAPEQAVIVAGPNRVLFGLGGATGGACEAELAARLLPALLADSACRRVELYGGDERLAGALTAAAERHRLPALSAADLLARMADSVARHDDKQGGRLPDLAQGPYAPRRARALSRGRLKRLAALAVALLVAHVASVILEARQFADLAAAAEQRMETVFRQAAPEGSRLVNPRAQLANIKARLGGQGGDFIDLSRMLHRAVAAQPGVTLQALTYDARSRSVRVEAALSDFADIEALKSHLREQGGALDDSGARQSEGRIIGEFTLREAPS